MSGIAKPCITFSGALPAAQAAITVNVEDVKAIDKQDISAFGIGRPAESRILVTFKDGSTKSFKFVSAAARNTSHANAVAAMAAVIA